MKKISYLCFPRDITKSQGRMIPPKMKTRQCKSYLKKIYDPSGPSFLFIYYFICGIKQVGALLISAEFQMLFLQCYGWNCIVFLLLSSGKHSFQGYADLRWDMDGTSVQDEFLPSPCFIFCLGRELRSQGWKWNSDSMQIWRWQEAI